MSSNSTSSSSSPHPLSHNSGHGKLLKCIDNINKKLHYIAKQNKVTDQTAHSPFSIFLGLLPTISATHGKALEQGIDFLSLTDREEVFELLILADYLKHNLKTVKITNGTFIQQGFKVKSDFRSMMNSLGVIEEVNFGDAETTRKYVNKFIEDATNGGNKDAIPQGIINALTVMILTNCLFYEEDWVIPFPESHNGYFGCQNGKYKLIEMMVSPGMIDCRLHEEIIREVKEVKEWEGDKRVKKMKEVDITKFTVLELPLGKDPEHRTWFGMFFTNTDDFDYEHPAQEYDYDDEGRRFKVEKKSDEPDVKKPELELPPFEISEYLDKLESTQCHITMPMFEQKISLKLKDILMQIGFTDIFSAETANLSGISDSKLFVQEILHDVNIKVDKKGVIASASTTTFNGKEGTKASPKKMIQVNHTFRWWIRDECFGIIKFDGVFDGK